MQLFTTLLVTLFSRDKCLAGRYVTYPVVVIMFVLPFGAVIFVGRSAETRR